MSELLRAVVFILVFVGAPGLALWLALEWFTSKYGWGWRKWRPWAVVSLAIWLATFSYYVLNLNVLYVAAVTAVLSAVWWVYFGTLARLDERERRRRGTGE